MHGATMIAPSPKAQPFPTTHDLNTTWYPSPLDPHILYQCPYLGQHRPSTSTPPPHKQTRTPHSIYHQLQCRPIYNRLTQAKNRAPMYAFCLCTLRLPSPRAPHRTLRHGLQAPASSLRAPRSRLEDEPRLLRTGGRCRAPAASLKPSPRGTLLSARSGVVLAKADERCQQLRS
jgi:hypothetical protein